MVSCLIYLISAAHMWGMQWRENLFIQASGPCRLRAIPCCRAQSMWSICTSLSKAAAGKIELGKFSRFSTAHRVCIYVLRWERIKPRTGRAGKKNLSILDRNSIQSDGRSFQFPDDEDSKMGWFLGWMRSSSKRFLDWPYGPYMAKVFISIWDMPKSKMRF